MVRLTARPTARWLALALVLVGVAVPARAQDEPAGVGVALALEYELRAWALGRDEAGLEAALVDADPRRRRAAVEALGRRLDGDRTAALLRALDDRDPRVVTVALEALERRGGLALLGDEVPGRFDRLATTPDPAQRAALARLLGRRPAALSTYSLWADGAERLARLEALAEDADPEVAGSARRGILTLELPPAPRDTTHPDDPLLAARQGLIDARLALLTRMVERSAAAGARGGDGAEMLAAFDLLGARPMDPGFGAALSAWALAAVQRTGASPVDGLERRTFLGLVEALRLAAGDRGDASQAVGAYAEWLLASFPEGLDLDASRRVDQLFERAAEAPDPAVAEALLREVNLSQRPPGPLDPRVGPWPPAAWIAARNEGRVEPEEYEYFCRELFARLVAGRTHAEAFRLVDRRLGIDSARPWFLEQFPGGLDAADLGPDFLADNRWLAPPGSERPSSDPWTHQALVDVVGLRHAFTPTAASEQLLLDSLFFDFRPDRHGPRGATYPQAASLFESGWSALCEAREALRAPDGTLVLGPLGSEVGGPALLDEEAFFEAMWQAFERFWRQSPGVRIDLLSKLPRSPSMDRFRPLLQIVGDEAGVHGTWRSMCVELLGACRGSDLAEGLLLRWLDEELVQLRVELQDRDRLERIEDVEFLGYARAFSGLGADGSELGEAGLELLYELTLELGTGAFETGKATLAALAKRPGGLARLDAAYLVPSGPGGRGDGHLRHRVEAALLCLGGEVPEEVLDRAVTVLLADYAGLAWDLRTRVVRALGARPGDLRVEAFLLALVRAGTEERPEPASVPGLGGDPWPSGASSAEVIAALDLATTREPAAALALLTEAAERAVDPTVRGAALDRLGGLFGQLARLDPDAPEVARGLALLEAIAFGDQTDDLADDERSFLAERALEALARFPLPEVQGQWAPQAVFGVASAWSGRDLLERWREGRPGSTEFAARTPVAIWAARGEAGPRDELLAAAGAWWQTDGRFLLQLADSAEVTESALAARLLDGARVALEAEPWLDGVAWARAVTRHLGLAWRGGDWVRAERLAEDLLARHRRGLVSASDLEAVLGPRSVQLGRDPVARLDALVLQARARVALGVGEVDRARELARLASERLGASVVALIDQEQLEAALP